MGCPSAAELAALFDPSGPRDARTGALLAHARECPRCREAALPSELPERGPAPRRTPRPAALVLIALGLSLVVASRFASVRRHAPRVEGASAVGSAAR